MTPDERLQNFLLSTKLGPVTPFFGIVNGGCECGKPAGQRQVRGKNGKLKTETHKPGKHPRSGGWQAKNATSDHATIRQWFTQYPNGNFAVISGVNTVALDLDVRPGKDGSAELRRLETASGQQLPPTVTVLSGSGTGAQHRYFKVPADVGALKKPEGTKAIDFQRNFQAVIVPGSLHESGHFYKFAPGLSPADIEVAILPDWLLELMQKPTAKGHNPAATEITDDIEELFDELLKMGPPPGSMRPGRLRPDTVVQRKMKTVPMRKYPDDRSHSDSHWAWTLARNTCHHWEQYLRLWKDSAIRTRPDTKCGRASYEADILNRAFLDQKQQWKNPRRPPIEQSANPALAKDMQRLSDQLEFPKSPIAIAVVHTNFHHPNLTDNGIAEHLNATGSLGRKVSRDYVKHIRHRYKHFWKSDRRTP